MGVVRKEAEAVAALFTERDYDLVTLLRGQAASKIAALEVSE